MSAAGEAKPSRDPKRAAPRESRDIDAPAELRMRTDQ